MPLVLSSCDSGVASSSDSSLTSSSDSSLTSSSGSNYNPSIHRAKEYALEQYLEPRSSIYYCDIYYAVDKAFVPNKQLTYSDFLNGEDLYRVDPYVDLSKVTSNSIPLQEITKVYDFGKDIDWYYISLYYGLFIKDYLDFLDKAEEKEYIDLVFSSNRHGGVHPVIPNLPIVDDSVTREESLMNSHAMKLFDRSHNFLDGYYNDFKICISRQSSGGGEYTFEEILPSFCLNSEAQFSKINDSSIISSLDNSLPEIVETANRDWYSVIFPFKMEAQYALQLFKELELKSNILYCETTLCDDPSLEIVFPQFKLFN